MTDDIIEITARELLGDLAKMSDSEKRARDFATAAHGDQKYGDAPYATHLAAVRDVLIEFGCAEQAFLIAAWLHDVLEDCGPHCRPAETAVTFDVLEVNFGADVVRLVWAVSGIGKSRAERNYAAYKKMKAWPEAILLKLADRIANMRASKVAKPELFKMYVREYAAFSSELRPVTKRYEVVCSEAMWRELDRLAADTIPPTPWPGASPNKRNDDT